MRQPSNFLNCLKIDCSECNNCPISGEITATKIKEIFYKCPKIPEFLNGVSIE